VSQRLKTVWSHYLWLKQDAEAKGRMHPSSAPAYPAPGKRFLIIRTEVQPPQHALRLGFDSFSSAFPALDSPFDYRAPATCNDDGAAGGGKADGNMSFKKRWSLLGKVLPFGASQDSPTAETKRTWEEELEQARRDTAASRLAGRGRKSNPPQQQSLGPPTPPKQGSSAAAATTPSSESISSTGSAPVFDAATFVFRFTLTWQTGPNGAPMPCPPSRDRIITRPRLPAPAQARVSVRSNNNGNGNNSANNNSNGAAAAPTIFRSDSPPPISPGLPPETRRVSGLLQTGLISEARNAKPLLAIDTDDAPPPRKLSLTRDSEKRLSLSINITPLRLIDVVGGEAKDEDDDDGERLEVQSPISATSTSGGFPSMGFDSDRGQPALAGAAVSPPLGPVPVPAAVPVVLAERPTGVYAPGAVYAGRALAEWGIVVGECNSFVDRRRDEGVLGLSEVEVPTLSVEGLGMRARG
jgi:hypothetical protein